MTEVHSTTGAGEVRHIVRAPLHRLISSAEAVLERRSSLGNENLITVLSKVLNHCEGLLAIVGSASDKALDHVPYADIAPRLAESGVRLLRLVESLPGEQSSVDVRPEINIICNAAKTFCQELRKLQGTDLETKAKRGDETDGTGASPVIRGLVLVVDDNEENRDVLSRRLIRDGHEVMLADGGRQALRMLQRYRFDILLLDIMMPDMDGYEVLAEVKREENLRELPVIMITAVDDIDSIVKCVKMGANDYLVKPFNRILLNARINALLGHKRLRDEEKRKAVEMEKLLLDVQDQRRQSQSLLENILPPSIATELNKTGSVQPMYFEDATIVFADIVGFTLSTEQIPADELVHILHDYFTAFDRIMDLYGLEKLKTIGDCYMFAGGLPIRSSSNPVDCVLAALEMVHAVEQLSETTEVGWRIRIGVNTGPVIAGVVGVRKFAFDIWGDTVNFGARVESAGLPNRVNLSAATYARVRDFFDCENTKVRVKEGREVDTFLVTGISLRLRAKCPALTTRECFAQRYSRYFRKPLSAFPEFDITTASRT